MRRLIASFLLAASSFAYAFPVSAQNAVLTEIQARQTRVQGYIDWLDNGEATGKNFSWPWPDGGTDLVVQEIQGWKKYGDYFRSICGGAGAPTNGCQLEAEKISPDPSNDYYLTSGPDPSPIVYDVHETVDYWKDRCVQLIGSAGVYKDIIGEAATAAGTPNLPEAAATIVKKVAADAESGALNALTPTMSSLQPHPCMMYYADLFYLMNAAGTAAYPGNFFTCVANWMQQSGSNPDPDGDGQCGVRAIANISWGKPTGCSTCAPSTIAVNRTTEGSKYYPHLIHHSPKPGVVGSPGGGDIYYLGVDLVLATIRAHEKNAADLRAQLASVGALVDKAKQDAAALAEELRKRGSVLTLPLPLSDISIPGVVGKVLTAILGIVGGVALLMFVWGGLQYMMGSSSLLGSGPDAQKISKAKKTITWAVLGLLAIFSSYAVLSLIINALQ